MVDPAVEDDNRNLLDDERNPDDETNLEVRIKPRRSVIVEPLVLMYFLSEVAFSDISSQYKYRRMADDMGIDLDNLTDQNSTNMCDINKSAPGFIARQSVQKKVVNFEMYLTIDGMIPTIILSLFFSAYTDVMGRRLMFILPCIGQIYKVSLCVMIVHFKLPLNVFHATFLTDVFGGTMVFYSNCTAYICDSVPKEKRKTRLVYLSIVRHATSAIGHLCSGYLIKLTGYYTSSYFSIGFMTTSLLYAIFLIPETIQNEGDTKFNWAKFKAVLIKLKEGLKLFTTDNGTGRRWQLIVLVLVSDLPNVVDAKKILHLFQLNAPLCWDSVNISYFNIEKILFPCFGLIVSALIFKNRVPPEWQLLMGISSEFVFFFFCAFVTNTVMMFIAPGLFCMTYLQGPMIDALMSPLVRPDEQGILFGTQAVLDRIAVDIGNITGRQIYVATLFVMEGFCFLVAAFFTFIALLLVVYYAFRINRKRVGEGRAEETNAINADCEI